MLGGTRSPYGQRQRSGLLVPLAGSSAGRFASARVKHPCSDPWEVIDSPYEPHRKDRQVVGDGEEEALTALLSRPKGVALSAWPCGQDSGRKPAVRRSSHPRTRETT